jgi:outer membrane protein assembly factor BamB
VPDVVGSPDTVYVKACALFRLAATAPGDRELRFVCDWGDSTDTTVAFRSGDTNELRHQWPSAGSFYVRFRAVLDGEENRASEWTEPGTIVVLANGIPAVPEFTIPERAVPNGIALFRATTTDPDGDSVSFLFDFGDAVGVWTTLVSGGETGLDSHRYATMDTFLVRCKAKDWKGSESDWSEPVSFPVGATGAVRWLWQLPEGQVLGGTSVGPVVLAGGRELVYLTEAYRNIHSLDVATGGLVGSCVLPDSERIRAGLTYCNSTGHLLVSTSAGIRTFTQSLNQVWQWPAPGSDEAANGTVVAGDLVYTCINDSIYCIRDLGASPEVVGSAYLPNINGLPAIDGSGYLVAACSDGFLYRFQPRLAALEWRRTLSPPAWSPAIGAGNRIYCGTPDTVLYCIAPDSSLVWQAAVPDRVVQPSLTGTTLLAGALNAFALSIELSDGSVNWQRRLDTTGDFQFGALLLTNGMMLCPTENGELYCLDQSDGSTAWSCSLYTYHPILSGTKDVDVSIAHNGDILLADFPFLYCVAGYPDGTLDTDAPWPKWQHDAYNTGRASGR